MMRFVLSLVVVWGLCLAVARPALAQDANTAAVLAAFAHHAEEGVGAAAQNDVAAMQRESIELHATWAAVEDAVNKADPGLYGEIEASLAQMDSALKATPLQPAVALAAFDHLMDEGKEGEQRLATGAVAGAAVAGAAPGATVAQFQNNLATALAAVEQKDEVGTEGAVLAAVVMWPAVEGVVAAKSPDAYTAIEAHLATASAAMHAEPVDWATAQAAVVAMQAALAPLAEQQSYTMFA